MLKISCLRDKLYVYSIGDNKSYVWGQIDDYSP